MFALFLFINSPFACTYKSQNRDFDLYDKFEHWCFQTGTLNQSAKSNKANTNRFIYCNLSICSGVKEGRDLNGYYRNNHNTWCQQLRTSEHITHTDFLTNVIKGSFMSHDNPRGLWSDFREAFELNDPLKPFGLFYYVNSMNCC